MSEDAREFQNKQVLVTGAGKGIGRATALLSASATSMNRIDTMTWRTGG
jgi:NADP-dependent 3-hydroxy acid dehydrogenase YdfG